MQGLTTFLWFDTQAEEAANYYTSVFDDGKIRHIAYNGKGGPGAIGTVLTVEFELAGQPFLALNGGPQFTFNEAVSIMITCDSPEEVDRYWEQLSEGGEKGPCGWLKDKYGLSWQIVPALLFDLQNDPDADKSAAVMTAMLKMGKLDSTALQAAYDNA